MKSCQASTIRKFVPRSPRAAMEERCISPDYVRCPVAKEFHEDNAAGDRCPFLHESLVQYCGASSVPKYIPYSESLLTRCGTENHRYCEQFMAYANPPGAGNSSGAQEHAGETDVEGIPFEPNLRYAANHMWFEVNEQGSWHIGLDAFLTTVMGALTAIRFVPEKWDGKPAVLLSAHGVDLPMVFPLRLSHLTENASLRAHPEWLGSRPYSFGWLFEGKTPGGSQFDDEGASAQIVPRADAEEWFRADVRTLTDRLHSCGLRSAEGLATDGGTLCFDGTTNLGREEVIFLFNEFFSPFRTAGERP